MVQDQGWRAEEPVGCCRCTTYHITYIWRQGDQEASRLEGLKQLVWDDDVDDGEGEKSKAAHGEGSYLGWSLWQEIRCGQH